MSEMGPEKSSADVLVASPYSGFDKEDACSGTPTNKEMHVSVVAQDQRFGKMLTVCRDANPETPGATFYSRVQLYVETSTINQ